MYLSTNMYVYNKLLFFVGLGHCFGSKSVMWWFTFDMLDSDSSAKSHILWYCMGTSTKKYMGIYGDIWGVWGISWHIPGLECIIYTNFKFKSLFEPIGFVVLYPIFGQTHITQILPSIYWKKGRKKATSSKIIPEPSRPDSWHTFSLFWHLKTAFGVH